MRLATLVLTFMVAILWGEDPHMRSVTPKVAKPGEVLDITGVALDAKNVEDVFLTDHKFDLKVKVLEQKDKSLKLRIPGFAKPGRMQLMILTGGDQPKLLEQPLYVLIEESDTKVAAND